MHKKNGKGKVVFGLLNSIFFAIMVVISACQGSEFQEFSDTGQLNLSFTTPGDVSHIDVQLYSLADASSTLVSETTLASGELTTLFPDLLAGDYRVEAQAYDVVASQIYSGEGSVTVIADALNNLCLLWMNQSVTSEINNAAPKIEYVEVDGNVIPETDLDAGANSGLHVIAPAPGELVTFTVGTSDSDGDSLSIAWAVKDGPNPEDNDVGLVCGTGDSITWFHDVEGTCYVQIHVSDGKGGSASFTFDLIVLAN